jgi:hypothetical protein
MNSQEFGGEPAAPPFDYGEYLDFLTAHNHNFFRLWTREQAAGSPGAGDAIRFSPLPFLRTGPGTALDGQPRFDLEQFDPAYFEQLRSRVEQARDRGIYVSVMLFNGFSLDDKGQGNGNACLGHPFNAENNVNGISVDTNGNDGCEEAHTLASPEITAIQERYVQHVIDTVGDLDNVLFEISNESHAGSEAWQYHLIELIKAYETGRPMAHPVGMTVEYPDGSNAELFASRADWISPNPDGGYQTDPPPADGSKVVILDTDHLWGIGGDRIWAWKAVTRGYSLLYMDCYNLSFSDCEGVPEDPARLSLLVNLGAARTMLEQMNLTRAKPQPELASTGYVLAELSDSVTTYLVYAPDGGDFSVDVTAASGELHVQWYDPEANEASDGGTVAGGSSVDLRPPFDGDAVVMLSRTGG